MKSLRRLSGAWNAPCGPRDVLLIAAPLMIAHSSWALTWFVDRMFLMWYSAEAMAAAMPAGMVHWTLVGLPYGIGMFVNTFVAQYCGAAREREVGRIVAQGMWLGILCVPLYLLVNFPAPYLFQWAGHEPSLLQLELDYFRWLNLGAGAMVIAAAQGAFFSGQGKTGVLMVVHIGGNLVNIFFDYALVFGAWGFPEMGAAGAALATAISHWFNVLLFGVLMAAPANRTRFGVTAWPRFESAMFRRLLVFGLPSALPMLIENAGFAVLMMMIAALGANAAAATTLAFNVNAAAFAPMFGIGTAAGVIVGNCLGADKPELAARGVWNAIGIGLIYSGLFALGYWLIPDAFLGLHKLHADPEEFAAVRELTVVLLRFVAAYCLFDAAQMILQGGLRGAGDTTFILIAATISACFFIGLGWVLQRAWGPDLMRWWWVMTFWIAALSFLYGLRFLQGRWKSMRVIEPDALRDLPH